MPLISRTLARIAIAIQATLVSVACVSCYQDLTSEMRAQEHETIYFPARIDEEIFRPNPIWLDQNRILFRRYRESPEGRIENAFFAVYDLERGTWDFLDELAAHHPCNDNEGVIFRKVRRVPNGTLAYLLNCAPVHRKGILTDYRSMTYYVYAWSEKTGTIETVFDFQADPQDSKLDPSGFDFSPDMEEFVFGLSNLFFGKLYRVERGGHIVPLVPHFFRAAKPEWSPDGESIAFLGIETYGGTPPDEVLFFNETRAIYRHPRDLYLMDPQGEDVRRIASGFIEIVRLQWLPQSSRYLVLAGEHRKFPGVWVPGIWLIDVETGKMQRLWDNDEQFGWSPEGKQLTIYDGYEEVVYSLYGMDSHEEWSLLVFDITSILPVSVE